MLKSQTGHSALLCNALTSSTERAPLWQIWDVLKKALDLLLRTQLSLKLHKDQMSWTQPQNIILPLPQRLCHVSGKFVFWHQMKDSMSISCKLASGATVCTITNPKDKGNLTWPHILIFCIRLSTTVPPHCFRLSSRTVGKVTRLHTRILTYKCTLTDCVHPLRQVDYETVTVDEGLTPGKCVPNVPRGIWLWSKMYQKRGIKLYLKQTYKLEKTSSFCTWSQNLFFRFLGQNKPIVHQQSQVGKVQHHCLKAY